MRIAFHFLVFFTFGVALSTSAFSREVKVNFAFSEFPDEQSIQAVLFLEIATDLINRDSAWQKRVDGAISRSKPLLSIPRVAIPDGSVELMVHGYLDSSGKRLYFPIVRKRIVDASPIVEISAEELIPRSDFFVATKEGYPFRSGENFRAQPSDIPSLINASEIFVRRSEFLNLKITDELWKSIYDLFSSNAANIASNSAENLPKLTSLLAAYASRSTDRAFVDFYSDFLNNLVSGKIGGVTVAGMSGEEFVFDQQKNLIERSAIRSLPSLNRMLTAYLNTRNYEKCIELATFSFTRLTSEIDQNAATYRGLGVTLLAKSIYNSMITTTNCAQFLFILEGQGSTNYPEGVARYASSQDWGLPLMEAFLSLNDRSRDQLKLNIDAQAPIQSFVVWFRSLVADST